MLSVRTSQAECVEETRDAAIACLHRHVSSAHGVLRQETPLTVLAFEEERLVGGMIGKVFWNWLYADLVWVEEEFRGRGIGTDVMRAAEEQARKMKLSGIYLWTQSWQAPSFYGKLGYSQFVELKGFPPGHNRLGFFKYLTLI